MLPPLLAAELNAIAADNRNGAMALARRTVEALLDSARYLESPEAVLEAARAVESAQPTMAPLAYLAGRLRRTAVLDSGLSASIARLCGDLLVRIEQSHELIVREALSLFAERRSRVLTHSYSETVAAVLTRAHEAGRLAGVIATESRPVCEGTELARRLAGYGIPVDLIIDAAAARLLPEASLVLVGADSLSPEGLVNKIGTHMIALAARERGVPVYAVCSSLKIVPEPLPEEPPKPAAEIANAPACRVRNYYFETTPVSLLTGVVTEEGMISYRGQ